MPRWNHVASRPLWLLGLALAGCGSATPRTERAPGEPTGVREQVASASAATTIAPCEGDVRCRVVARTAAGTDERGAALFVIETSRGSQSIETGAPTDDPDEPSCELHEYHLERAGTFERVLSICNDGYGAAGVGEDTVTVEANRLVHEQSGGSAWRWATHSEEQLAPRRLLATSASGYWNLGPNTEDRHFDVAAFRGRVSWYSPACGSEEAESGEMDDVPAGAMRAYLLLPIVELDPGFDPATTRVAACGTRIDATEASSFLLSGTRGEADDAWLEIVATRGHEVIVLVHDDLFVAGGDRLTVHVGPSAPSYMEHCVEPTNDHVSVVFDASSGAVLEGDATAIGARMGHAVEGRSVRFSMPEGGAVTVTYTDADALGVERTFATSELRDGDTHSLGTTSVDLGGLEVSCVVERDALVRVLHPSPAR
jgi:hypothetical protein